MNTKHLVPAFIALGLAVGSTSALAQTLGTSTDLGTSVEATDQGLGANTTLGVETNTPPAATIPPVAGAPNATVTAATLASTEDLVGVTVYDRNEARIGEVSAVLPAQASGEAQLVIDVGGFLGFGAKPVALASSDAEVRMDADGEIDFLIVHYTEAELEAMPEVDM